VGGADRVGQPPLQGETGRRRSAPRTSRVGGRPPPTSPR
jgi:hypothetical protein